MKLNLFLKLFSMILCGILGIAPLMAWGAPAPHVRISGFDQLAQPLPLPYDVRADGMKQIAAARAKARLSGKLLLIDLGGNWCPDCRVLAGTLALPEVATFVRQHYEVVLVNIGRYDRNMNVPAHYGLGRPAGVPSVLVVDPKTDALLNRGHTEALADARSMSPQALADWVAQWTR